MIQPGSPSSGRPPAVRALVAAGYKRVTTHARQLKALTSELGTVVDIIALVEIPPRAAGNRRNGGGAHRDLLAARSVGFTRSRNAYGCFGVLYSASFWNGSQTVS